MGQLTLLGTDPRPLPREDGGTSHGDLGPEQLPSSAAPDPEQIDLFTERARLARDLEGALWAGDFLAGRGLRRLFEKAHGVSAETRALSFLEELADALASPVPGEALPAWSNVDRGLQAHPRLRRIIEGGVLGRLLRDRSAADLAAAWPGSLPALGRILISRPGASPEDGRRVVRGLVRDSLIAGRRLDSLDFRGDAALADLLSEDDAPPWLACLGVIRRLWPAPHPSSDVVAALSLAFTEPAPEEPALAFWFCLQVAEDRDCAEADLHQARRRMKSLRPAFHELYMRRPTSRV